MRFALDSICVIAKLLCKWFAFGCSSMLSKTDHLDGVNVHAEKVEDVEVVQQTVVPLKINFAKVLRIHVENTWVRVRLANLEDCLQLGLVIETVSLLIARFVNKLEVHMGDLVKLLKAMLGQVHVNDILELAQERLVLAGNHEEALSIGGFLSLVDVADRVLVLNITGTEDDALLTIAAAVDAFSILEIVIVVALVCLWQWDCSVERVNKVVHGSLVVAGHQSSGAFR